MTRSPRTAAFSDELIDEGFWFVVALMDRAKGISADVPDELRGQVDDTVDLLTPILEHQGIVARLHRMVAEAAVASRHRWTLRRRQAPSSAGFDKARALILDEWGLASSKGALIWPPTARTIAVRLGDGAWNTAMETYDMKVSQRGRERGAGKFSDDDFCQALRRYASEDGGQGLSFTGYTRWATRLREQGVNIPSPATIRQKFGTWGAALTTAGLS
ncbi:hypothetical protein [Schaalia suimastitidis]|uniref:hypothetical protein n=1 Tax=Schaalia suimastitidis TaxID=121163 RepID=UPI0004291419|nr:hypothetical protein [Schaalia suimastitidis]